MQLIKFLTKFLVFLVSTIFVLLLISTTISFSFAEITKPENVKPVLSSMLASSLPRGQELSKMQSQIRHDCENKTELQIPLDSGDEFLTLNCSDAKSKPVEEVILDSMFNDIYYKDYGCNFLECFEKNKNEPPYFLFAKVANDFFQSLNTKVIIAAIIVGIILLLLGGIRIVAKNLITAGLPFIILLVTRNSVMQQISSRTELQPLLPLVTSLDALFTKIFGIFLVLGILLYIISFIFRKIRKMAKKAEEKAKKKKVKLVKKKLKGRAKKRR